MSGRIIFFAALHAIPILLAGASGRKAVNYTAEAMVFVAFLLGNPRYAIFDLTAIGIAYVLMRIATKSDMEKAALEPSLLADSGNQPVAANTVTSTIYAKENVSRSSESDEFSVEVVPVWLPALRKEKQASYVESKDLEDLRLRLDLFWRVVSPLTFSGEDEAKLFAVAMQRKMGLTAEAMPITVNEGDYWVVAYRTFAGFEPLPPSILDELREHIRTAGDVIT